MVGLRQQCVQRNRPAQLSDDSDDGQFAIPGQLQGALEVQASNASSEISSDESVNSVIINQTVNVAMPSTHEPTMGKLTSKINSNFIFSNFLR